MPKFLASLTFLSVLAAAISVGQAQERPAGQPQDKTDSKADGQTVPGLKTQDPVPPATGRNLSEQNAAQEPSSKIPGSNGSPNVFVNGVLSVPGASPDGHTAPAKFSAQNNADDQLPVAGYRLKLLTAEQRREIAVQLGKQSESGGANSAYAIIGAEIPAPVAGQALTATPEALTEKFPSLRGTAYMMSGSKVVIVDLDNSVVVGVLDV